MQYVTTVDEDIDPAVTEEFVIRDSMAPEMELVIEYRVTDYVFSVPPMTLYEDVLDRPVEYDDLHDYLVWAYKKVIELLFPGYTGREEPWTVAPMVMTLKLDGRMLALGHYR